jgi:hypothetical protein
LPKASPGGPIAFESLLHPDLKVQNAVPSVALRCMCPVNLDATTPPKPMRLMLRPEPDIRALFRHFLVLDDLVGHRSGLKCSIWCDLRLSAIMRIVSI